MPIQYKINVLKALKEAGYDTDRLRREKLLGVTTIQGLCIGKMVSHVSLGTVCRLLQCQPGDILEYVQEEEREVLE